MCVKDGSRNGLWGRGFICNYIEIEYLIHRRAAKCAEKIYFMFAVDPPKILADWKDGKHKGQFVSNPRNYLCVME